MNRESREVFERMRCLEDMLRLTHAVQERVEAGDWESASELESQRRPMVEAFFAASPAPEEEERAREVLREMLDVSNRSIGLAQHVQRSVAMKASTMQQGRRAIHEYSRHGAPDAKP